jgi:hypothetical protein
VPCYWKIDGQNYKRYDLTDGTLNAVADGITARGRVLYITGRERDISYYPNKVVKYTPFCYWKNGTKTQISGNGMPYGSSIAVSESGDVYVTYIFCGRYWKNGAPVELPDLDSDEASLSDVFISGNDVYIAGQIYVEDNKKLIVYWKNGERTTVFSVPNTGAIDLRAQKLFVLANKVYLSFNQVHNRVDPPGSNNVLGIDHWEPYLRQDDYSTPLAYDTSGSTSAVYVTESGDVYAAGTNNGGKLCYWKNGERKDISVPARLSSSPINISVWKGDVYIAGANYIGNGSRYRPCYIKISEDGAETLNYLSATDGCATGIAQVQ